MSDNIEEIQKSVKKYLMVGAVLILGTVITVALSYKEFSTHSLNIIVGMILATIKALLVALIFMHLNHESSIIYKILAFTAVFALVLFILFYFSNTDPLTFAGFYSKPE